MLEGYWGPLIRTVSSIDASEELYATTPGQYTSMTKTTGFKYNKFKYFWYLNGYLYMPNLDWDAIKVEAIFTEDATNDANACTKKQDLGINVPEFLLAEIESMVIKDLGGRLSIPTDLSDDNINPNR
jgi:hypothetical protein